MFSIDGLTWTLPCRIERVTEVRSSEISGMLLDRTYFNDVLGTFLRYDVALAVPIGRENDYYAIYEAVTAPVDGHTFVFPYNGDTVTVTGRVESLQDAWVRMPGEGNYWKGITFSVTANHPTRQLSLSEALTRGRSPVPEIYGVSEGDTYTYVNGRWQAVQPDESGSEAPDAGE